MKFNKKTGLYEVTHDHHSGQFSDSDRQHEHDAEVVFSRDADWFTGTEAGEDPMRTIYREAAHDHGCTFFQFKSNWIAIRESLIKKHSYKTFQQTVVDNSQVIGPGHDLNYVGASFVNENLGQVTVIGSHYATKGTPSGRDAEHRRNLAVNKVLAEAIVKAIEEYGQGRAIAFYGGDQNIVDTINDTFFGGDVTSAWDELGRYENTGHGNIDVIATYDKDKRVTALSAQAFDDSEVRLASDHFLIEARFSVRPVIKIGG